MPITLNVQSYRAAPPAVPTSACFHTDGGTIGRTPGNGLVLDDPGRYISRSHARVEFHGGEYCLVDTGSNPSLINGRPLGKGRQRALADGDQLAIGEYVLEVLISADAPAEMTMPFRPAPGAEAPQPGAAPDLPAAFIEPLSSPAQDAAAKPDVPADPQPSAEHGAPAEPLLPAVPPSPVPDPDPVPVPVAPPMPGFAAGGQDPTYAALLRGLGLPALAPDRNPVEMAELVGAMLREATAGTMGLLLARTLIKRESQLPVTMLVGLSNNPLKFFPNADGALRQMLGPAKSGYMPPPAAYANAFEDMRLHWLAVTAGMHAALQGVYRHFDPARIARALPEPSVMDKMLQAKRKAKLWDGFVATYRQATADTDDEFQRDFGEQFSIAYEAELAQLQQAQAAPPPSDHTIV